LSVQIIHGDCRAALDYMPSNSVHSIVTDPPYALVSISKRFAKSGRTDSTASKSDPHQRFARGFMGKTWDNGSTAFDPEFWFDAMRVLRPGGHVLAFGGTRTYHRLACAIEDAGFEIRDQIGWLYGSGFPKSHNQGGEWEGWGTALKPAWEPIVVARKPLDGTNAQNLARWGVGALNIDGCRVDGVKGVPASVRRAAQGVTFGDLSQDPGTGSGWDPNVGRWPANIIHDGSDEVLDAFPADLKSGTGAVKRASGKGGDASASIGAESRPAGTPMLSYGDRGSAARFFYCAKASRKDRDNGLSDFEKKLRPSSMARVSQLEGLETTRISGTKNPIANSHPTVKPTPLMQYLCRLVTPPGGTVLDPFMGSGSTGRGAVLEGFNFIGCELSEEYVAISRARIAAVEDTSPAPNEIADAGVFG
jgi:site-specific DNA-methyltransferase (adenine-specific)